MKNYKVIATRYFRDSNEIDEETGLKKEREVNDEFYCTKERYEFLKANNAVKLVKIVEEIKNDSPYEEDLQIDNDVKIEEKPKKKKSKKK